MSANRANVIAKNTLFLYIRTFILLILSIYSSRVLLSTLGVEDFGLYNLVGGVVGLFASLKVLFASAIQRFLNYEKGLGDPQRVRQVFNLSLLVQLCIAVIFAIVVEAAGLWFITHKLVIPQGSLAAAHFVFHCSVVTAVVAILSTPYDAAIIANEKINAFAWITVADGVLKLLVIFLLPLLPFERIKVYALFLVLLSLLVRFVSVWYCRRFHECKFMIYWDKSSFVALASFAGWNFFGNTAFALVNEGLNMLLNIFGGVVANAARGIAFQVRGAVMQLSGNLLVAAQPYIMQQAATVEREQTFAYIHRVSRALFFIVTITVLPLIVYCEQLLSIWLVETPEHAVVFVRIMLVYTIVRTLHGPLDLAFKAFGKIQKYQLVDSFTLFLSLPFSYVALRFGMPLYWVFIIICLVEFMDLIAIIVCGKRVIGLHLGKYLREVGLSCCNALLLSMLIGGLFYYYFTSPNLLVCICYFLLLYIVETVVIYSFVLSSYEREYVNGLLKSVIRKFVR